MINDVNTTDDYDKIKIISCKGDKLPTYQTVFGTDNKPYSPTLRDDYFAYNENNNNLSKLAVFLRKFFQKKAADDLLVWKKILLKCLKVVWIPINEDKDDIQSIFETLNDRGRPLTASELICNYLFKPLSTEEPEKFNEIHNEKWLHTITEIDRNGDVEDYLRTLFSIGESVAIGGGRTVYVHIKKKHKNLTKEIAHDLLDKISNDVSYYNYVVNPHARHPHHKYKESMIHSLLVDIADTRMESSRYFIIEILKAFDEQDFSLDDTTGLLKELLTALVRRKISGLPTNMYNRVFPSLFSKLRDCDNKIKLFIDHMIENRIYVTDEQFKDGFVNNKLYTTNADLPFTRMVLKNIDKSQEPFSQHADFDKFNTVEHIMPQKLTREWMNHIGNDTDNPMLKLYTNSIGNLCLLNVAANSHAKQGLFEIKIKDYPDASFLTRYLKGHIGSWDIQAIASRSERLAEIANGLWAWTDNRDGTVKMPEDQLGITFLLFDKKKEADARGRLVDETGNFIVYKDSICNTNLSSSIDIISDQREALRSREILELNAGELVFIKDHTFTSPSTAAAVVRGGAANGWKYWITQHGASLAETYPEIKKTSKEQILLGK